MNKQKALGIGILGIGAYLFYKSMKKSQIASSGYIFPNGFADLPNWRNADDGTDSSDNKLTKMMVAIAEQEGFNIPGSIPQRANNPGDLTKSLGFDITGETLGSAGIVVFTDVPNGWAALQEQLELIKKGFSIHKLTDTLMQFAHGYTTTQQDEWANNVASKLGYDSSVTLEEILS